MTFGINKNDWLIFVSRKRIRRERNGKGRHEKKKLKKVKMKQRIGWTFQTLNFDMTNCWIKTKTIRETNGKGCDWKRIRRIKMKWRRVEVVFRARRKHWMALSDSKLGQTNDGSWQWVTDNNGRRCDWRVSKIKMKWRMIEVLFIAKIK